MNSLNYLSRYATLLYKNFASYTADRLAGIGLNFGALSFIVYIGKYPGCTQSSVKDDLKMDWGHCQRSISRLVEDGFVQKEKGCDRSWHLTLSQKGDEAFLLSHQVFKEWDDELLSDLTDDERAILLSLLKKICSGNQFVMPVKEGSLCTKESLPQ